MATELDLVVDAGRLASLPDRGLLAAADRVLLLVLPTAGQLARLTEELPWVRELCGDRLTCEVGWSGPLVHRTSEVATHLECDVAALPYDPRTAGAVAGRPGSLPPAGRRLGWWQRWRFPLLEAVRTL